MQNNEDKYYKSSYKAKKDNCKCTLMQSVVKNYTFRQINVQ